MPRKNGTSQKATVTKKKAKKVVPEQLSVTSATPQNGTEELATEEAVPVFDGLANEDRYQRISRRAYELYEQRGWDHGNDVDDWLTAEKLEEEERSGERSQQRE